ncbi:MAG: septal ring lytic transglycosylase RlpA family protein, partial [Bryobacteraceae bacterium]
MKQPRRIARGAALVAAVAVFSLLSGCRKHHRVAPLPPAPRPAAKSSVPLGYTQVGVASWYGIPFDGHRAADGEIFNMEDLVAAHRLL